MNILDMMNKLTALSQPLNESKDTEKTHKGGTTTTDEKGTVHKGKYGTEYQGDEDDEELNSKGKAKAKKPAAPAEKRGRGRPAKGADKDGNVMKPDFSQFGAKTGVKLKPWDKAKTVKHSLKDWIENLDRAINEDGQMTATPLPGATAIKNAQGQQVATAATPQAAAMMTKGDVTLTDPTKSLGEEANGKSARIMFNRELGEYTVKFYLNGKHLADADYYTDDREDARQTAKEGCTKRISERDDREDDEHGGGPTPWENPDKGWTPPKKVSGPGAMAEGKKAKPDFLDKDKDGNKKEPFKKAVKDAKKLDEISDNLAASTVKGRIQNNVKANDRANTTPQTKDSAARNAKAADATSAKLGKTYDAMGKRNARKLGETEQVNELSKGTLKSYAKKSQKDRDNVDDTPAYGKDEKAEKARILKNRDKGMDKAKAKMAESKMSELDLNLKDPKCSDAEFKKQYGKSKADMRAAMKDKPDAKKPTSKLKENLLRESHETLKHIIDSHKHEVKNFVAGEEMAEELYDALYDYYCAQGEMPYGTMKARDGDPYEWVANRFDRDVQDHDVPVDEAVNPIEIPAFQRKQSGRDFPATLGQVNRNDSMSHLPNLKAAGAKLNSDPFGFGPATPPVQFENWDRQLSSLLAEGMNVVANTGLGDAPDSVTISATDHDAASLLALVKSAGLGMFANDAAQGQDAQQSQAMSAVPGEGSEQGEADIEVVDDHDGMLSLIRKMTGQGEAPVKASGPDEQEVDEACQGCSEGNCQQHGDQVVDEEDQDPGQTSPDDEFGEKAIDNDTNPFSDESDDEYQANSDARTERDEEEEAVEEDETPEEETEEVEESFANDSSDTFEADIDFMQNVITGGVNGKKKTQSVGNPVTVASTPMKESSDLLSMYKKLSGL